MFSMPEWMCLHLSEKYTTIHNKAMHSKTFSWLNTKETLNFLPSIKNVPNIKVIYRSAVKLKKTDREKKPARTLLNVKATKSVGRPFLFRSNHQFSIF